MPKPPAVEAKTEHKLTDKQRAFADHFVRAKLDNLDVRYEDIAKAAGYAGNSDSLRVIASRTVRHPAVRAYLRDQAREHMADGGMDVAIALRELTAQREDKRVRLDAARLLGGSLGITTSEDQGGSGIVLNLMFAGVGAALAQQPGDAAQVIENARETRAARSLAQEEGRRPPVRMVTAPPIELDHAEGGRGAGGGDFARAEEKEGDPSSYLPPQSVGVAVEVAPKISRPSEPRVLDAKGKPIKKPRAKAKKRARVVRKPRVKPDV